MNETGRFIAAWLLTSLAGCEVTLAPSCNASGEAVVDVSEERPGAGGTPRTSSPAAVCPGPRRSGLTECFPGECGPGQYCDDRSGHATCRPGCTSDMNCGDIDVCVRAAGAAIGRCESCAEQPRRTLDACGSPDRAGTTPCFPGECAAGQYCVDAGLSHCEPGCTSDANCGPAERCERPEGSALGICQSCDFVPPA